MSEAGKTERVWPFIVGCPRSGTTLVRAILDSHRDLAVVDESYFIPNLAREVDRYETDGGFNWQAFLRDLVSWQAFQAWGIDEETLRAAFSANPPVDYRGAVRSVYRVYADLRGKRLWGDKTPVYVKKMPLVARLFPEARFVHVIRDGRDVALSLLEVPFGADRLADNARMWARHVAIGRRDGARLGPSRYTELRHEDLVRDPETSVRRVCHFLGLAFDPAMLRFYEREELRRDPRGPTLVLQPPTPTIRHDWRRDMTFFDATLCEAVAGDLLRELGYEPLSPRPGPAVRARARAMLAAGSTVSFAHRAAGALRRWAARRIRLATTREGDKPTPR